MPKKWPTSCNTVRRTSSSVGFASRKMTIRCRPPDRVVDPHQAVGVAVLDDDRHLAHPVGELRRQRVERLLHRGPHLLVCQRPLHGCQV